MKFNGDQKTGSDSTRAGYALERDVDRMSKVGRVDAHEAAIFYASRILEVIASDMLNYHGLESTTSLFTNLNTLQQYELISATTRCWAHGLRRLGNDVRHIRRSVSQGDSQMAMIFAERCLRWGAFCTDGPSSQAYNPESLCDHIEVPPKSRQIIEQIEAIERPDYRFELSEVVELLQITEDASPLAAAVIELLLEKQMNDSAGQVLGICTSRFPDSLRILQLQVLYFSREKKYDEAVALGEKVLKRNKDDEESIGILAGAYKRSWQRDRLDGLLERAHHLYAKGWSLSRKRNYYLGINSSGTSILLGRLEPGEAVASNIYRQLSDRRDKLRLSTLARLQQLGAWDQLTLAESALQLQHFEEASELYRIAYRNSPGAMGSYHVAIEQVQALLEAFGWPGNEIESWINRLR